MVGVVMGTNGAGRLTLVKFPRGDMRAISQAYGGCDPSLMRGFVAGGMERGGRMEFEPNKSSASTIGPRSALALIVALFAAFDAVISAGIHRKIIGADVTTGPASRWILVR